MHIDDKGRCTLACALCKMIDPEGSFQDRPVNRAHLLQLITRTLQDQANCDWGQLCLIYLKGKGKRQETMNDGDYKLRTGRVQAPRAAAEP